MGVLIKQRREALGMSQEAVAEAAHTSQSTVDRVERDDFKRMPSSLPLMAKVLGLSLEDLDPALAGQARPLGAPNIPGGQLLGTGRDFPIHAAAEGGAGQIIVASEPIDWMPRPSPVAHVRTAYGLYIVGESMVPEYEPGDIALVNPLLPLITNVTCIFYREREGEARATIKRMRRFTEESWHVRQWNPPEGMKPDFILSRREWTTCHRTLGKYSRG